MKVYVVETDWYATYEDHFSVLKEVYSSLEAAKASVYAKGYTTIEKYDEDSWKTNEIPDDEWGTKRRTIYEREVLD